MGQMPLESTILEFVHYKNKLQGVSMPTELAGFSTESISACPMCGKGELVLLDDIDVHVLLQRYCLDLGVQFSSDSADKMTYISCVGCGLKYFSPMLIGDHHFYQQLQKNDWYYQVEKAEFEYVKKLVQPADLVLDIGCGEGAFGASLEGADYTGLELNPAALEKGQKKGLNIIGETIEAYSAKYPEKFDLVCSFQVLEHVRDPHSFIKSKLAALKPGGRLAVSVPCENGFLSRVVNGILNMPPHHVTRWTDKALENLANQFGLKLENIWKEAVQPIHYQFYYSSSIRAKIRAPKLLDSSFSGKIVSKISNTAAKILVGMGLRPKNVSGHSVVAIYQKP